MFQVILDYDSASPLLQEYWFHGPVRYTLNHIASQENIEISHIVEPERPLDVAAAYPNKMA